MDTNVIHYVITVAESGSISAAARKLFLSQPALTKQISKLENQIGIRIFDRSKRRTLRGRPHGSLSYCESGSTAGVPGYEHDTV